MKLIDIVRILEGEILCSPDKLETEFINVFASDLMSEVLTVEESDLILISGLSNIQIIRTAEMLDIQAVIIVGNKSVNYQMTDLAESLGIVIIKTKLSMFLACGVLHEAGLTSIK